MQRSYQGNIQTVGLKIDLSLRLQVGFMFRTPFKRLYYKQPIELSRGVDVVVPGICHITYAKFKETSGGILFIGYPLGLSGGFSFVTGGQLVPIENEADGIIPKPPQETGVHVLTSEEHEQMDLF